MKGNFILGDGFIYVLLNAFTLVKLKVRQKLIRYSKLSVMYCNLELGSSRELPSYNDTSILLGAIPYEKKSIGEYWIQYLPILFFHTGFVQPFSHSFSPSR